MRTTLIAAAAAAAVLAGASAAGAADLRAHLVSDALVPIARADDTTVALQQSVFTPQATMVLRDDDRSTRTIAAPAGCTLSGAGHALVAGLCGRRDHPDSSDVELFVAGLDGVPIARFTTTVAADNANGYAALAPTGVGRQWLAIPNGGKDTAPWTTTVNWHTGETRDFADDPERVIDLDGSAPVRPTCATRGQVVLAPGEDGSTVLSTCGGRRRLALPKGFHPAALGDGWAFGAVRRAGHRLQAGLVRLSYRRARLYTLSGVPGAAAEPDVSTGWALFTHHRLYATDGTRTVTVVLPTS